MACMHGRDLHSSNLLRIYSTLKRGVTMYSIGNVPAAKLEACRQRI